MSEVAVPSFPSYSCSEHFPKYRWKSPYVSNDCLWKLYLYLDFNCQNLTFVFTHSVNQLACELRPLIGNFAKTFHHRYLKESKCAYVIYIFFVYF